MFHDHAQGPLGPQAPPPRHGHRRRPRRRLPRRHARARRHHARRLRPGLHRRQRRHRRRRPQRRRDRRRGARVRGLIDAGLVDQVAAVDGVAAAVPSIEGVATILGSDGDRIGGDGPPTDATNWVDDPDAQPLPPRRGPRPGGRRRGRHRPRRRPRTATSPSATAPRCSRPTPVEVTVVGIATFGDADSLGPTTYTAFTLPRPHASCSPTGPTRISSVLVAAEDGVSQETPARRDQPS